MDKPNALPSVSIPTEADIQSIQQSLESYQASQTLSMALHLRPLLEFVQMSVDEKRQALIEWKLQYDAPTFTLNKEQNLVPQWHFSKSASPQERAELVQTYERHLDLLRNAPGFEIPEVKIIVQERRNALNEAVHHPSAQTLQDILDNPGFERFKSTKNMDTLTRNARSMALIAANRAYPSAFLYHLFHDPPSWLQHMPQGKVNSEKLQSAQEQKKSLEAMKPRERQFIYWLQDAYKHTVEGWLSLEKVIELNERLSPKQKVFKHLNRPTIDSDSIRALLYGIRKYAGFENAIETNPQRGQAWRLRTPIEE